MSIASCFVSRMREMVSFELGEGRLKAVRKLCYIRAVPSQRRSGFEISFSGSRGRGSGGRREKRIYNTLKKKKKNRSGIQLIWLFFPNTGKSKIIV